MVIDEGNNQDTELTAKIGKYTNNLMMIYPRLKEKHILGEVKTTIYSTMLKPILKYGGILLVPYCEDLLEATSS